MKLGFLLLLLPLRSPGPSSQPAVRVAFSPLTKAAYLQAKKSCVVTKPQVTFPLKKQHGRISIPTTNGQRVFRDRGMGTDNDDQAQFEYLGYLPQFKNHVVLGHFYEWSQWFLVDESNRQLELYDAPLYSPDQKSFVVLAAGLEYSVYPNSLRLFQFKEQKWQEVWSLEPTKWEPIEACWSNPNTLLLKKKNWTPSDFGNSYSYGKLTIK